MFRKAISLLLSLFIFSGCAVKLPPKVDYTIDVSTKPEIEQVSKRKLNQVTFESKIDEITVKTEKFVFSDPSKAELGRKANVLLTAQQEYYLRNISKAKKTGVISAVAGFLSCFITVGLFANTPDANMEVPASIVIHNPIPVLLLFGLGYGLGYSAGKGPEVDNMNSYELNELIRNYNQTIGEQGKQ